MCLDRRKNHGCGQKKPEGTCSAIIGVGTAAKYCEVKRCADQVRSRTDNKDEVVEGNFNNFNFLPSTNFHFHLQISSPNFTSIELNRFAKQAKL